MAVGLLSPVKNLTAIYDLGPLNKLLAADGPAAGQLVSISNRQAAPPGIAPGAAAVAGARTGPTGAGRSRRSG